MELDSDAGGTWLGPLYEAEMKGSSTGFNDHTFTDRPDPHRMTGLGLLGVNGKERLNNAVVVGLDADWSPRGSNVLAQNMSPSYGIFSPPCYFQEDQDWSFTTQYPVDSQEKQNEEGRQESKGGIPIAAAAGSGAPIDFYSTHDHKKQPSSPESITAPPNSPEYFSAAPSLTVTPLNSDAPSFTVAAHQAVVDLFPEIADTCIFRVKAAFSDILEAESTSSITRLYSALEPREIYHSVPFSGSQSPKRKRVSEPPQSPPAESLDPEDPQEEVKESILPTVRIHMQTPAPIYSLEACESLKSDYLPQLPHGLVNLDIQNQSGLSHVFGTPGESSSPNITISPRQLTKLQTPSTPPSKSAFDPEEPERYRSFSKPVSDQELRDSDDASLSDNDMISPSPISTPTPLVSRSLALHNSKELLKEQNRLLLRWRSEGISYRTIKKKLGINEAESTLRGRLRTLTKPKNERLRKPQWTEEDIELLLEIVDPSALGVKWKQVSDTIVSLGGSYRFGPSTCKKQYLKLVEEGRAASLLGCGTVVGKRSRIEFEGRESRRHGRG